MSELLNTLVSEFEDPEYAHAYLDESGNMRIAAQVRALRLQRKWSQQELAERAGMRQERISKIEMADFDSLTLKTLRRLAQAFDVHMSVRFTSVSDALADLVSLKPVDLLCEPRERSLDGLRRNIRTGFYAKIPTPTAASFFEVRTGDTVTTSSQAFATIILDQR